MTQPPLGTTPGGPGPFDERGPGFPDVASSGTHATFDQYADRPVGEPLDTTLDQTSPYPATMSGSYDDATSTESDSTVDTAKGEAKQVAGTALESGKDVAQTAKSEAANVAAGSQAAGRFAVRHRPHRSGSAGQHPAAAGCRCRSRPGQGAGRHGFQL